MTNNENDMFEIHEIGTLELGLIIEFRTPYGKYWTEVSPGKYVAVDNNTGDAWTEEFEDKEIMLDWLNDKFEMGDIEEWKALKMLKIT